MTTYRDAHQFTSSLVANDLSTKRLNRRLADSTIHEATNKANEIGASVRKAIKQLRGGSTRFYRDLIAAARIVNCQDKVENSGFGISPAIRYVNGTDNLAYRDSNGDCIFITITPASDREMVTQYRNSSICEVAPNCYWSTIDKAVDTDRVPVYATNQNVQPAEGSMTYADAEDKLKKWRQSLLVFAVPGLILAAPSLLTMIIFLVCRCCCNGCGGHSPRDGGCSCLQKFLLLLFFLLFAVGVVAVAGMSLLYQKTLTDAVDDTFNTTLSTLNDTGTWLVRIRTLNEEGCDKAADSADTITQQLADTSFIDQGIYGLIEALTDFEEGSANRALPTGCTVKDNDPYCVSCSVCSSISIQVGMAKQQIMDNAGDGVNALQRVRDIFQRDLVEVSYALRSSMDKHVDDLNTFITTVYDMRATVIDWYIVYDNLKVPQEVGVFVVVALALLAVVLGLLGIVFGLTSLKVLANIIHVAYIIGFIALILTFLVSAILLAISVLLGDACELSLIFAEDWTVVVSGKVCEIVNVCFQGKSIIDVLELTPVLEFARGGIQFPVIDMATVLDFSDLDTLAATIQSVDSSTFQVDQRSLDDDIDALNTYTKQSTTPCDPNDGDYAETNILAPWNANDGLHPTIDDGLTYMVERYRTYEPFCPDTGSPGLPFTCDPATMYPCTFPTFIGETYKKASTLAAMKVDAAAFVAELHERMTDVMTYTSTFKVKTMDLNDKVNSIKSDFESNLFRYAVDIEREEHCTFMMDGYLEYYNSLCGDLMPALTVISLLLFLVGVFLIPVTVCLIIAVKRLKVRGNNSRVGPGDDIQVK